MTTRYDVDAIAANARTQLEAMASSATSGTGKSAYRANEAYIEFVRWACGEINRLTEGDSVNDLLRSGAMVIAQQMLGMANLVTSKDRVDDAVSLMVSEVVDFLEMALNGEVPANLVATPIVEVGDA